LLNAPGTAVPNVPPYAKLRRRLLIKFINYRLSWLYH